MKKTLNNNEKEENNENIVDTEVVPSYDDVTVERENLDDVHNYVDRIKTNSYKEELGIGDNGGDVDSIDLPESVEVAAHKFDIKPDIAPDQRHDFDPNLAFFGTHVVNSNTKRKDNPRHLLTFDCVVDYDYIPTRRQRSNQLRQRATAEFQMGRGNPEIGGFDRKLQRAVIKREDIDLRQTQTVHNGKRTKKSGLFNIFGKKGEQ